LRGFYLLKSSCFPLFQRRKEKDKSPSFPLFLRGIKNNFPSLEKRGQGRFYFNQIPLHPPLQKGEKKKSNFPSLEKRGPWGIFIPSNPPSSPFFKGGK